MQYLGTEPKRPTWSQVSRSITIPGGDKRSMHIDLVTPPNSPTDTPMAKEEPLEHFQYEIPGNWPTEVWAMVLMSSYYKEPPTNWRCGAQLITDFPWASAVLTVSDLARLQLVCRFFRDLLRDQNSVIWKFMFYATVSKITIPKQMNRVLHEVSWRDPTIRFYLVQVNNSNKAKEFRNYVNKLQRASHAKVLNIEKALKEMNEEIYNLHFNADYKETQIITRNRGQTTAFGIDRVVKKVYELQKLYTNESLTMAQNWLARLDEQKEKYKVHDPVYIGWLKSMTASAAKYEESLKKNKINSTNNNLKKRKR